METLVPSITTPNLTPGTDTGTAGGSLDISGTDVSGLKPGTSLNVMVQTGLDGLVSSVKLEVNNQLFQLPARLNLVTSNQNPQLADNQSFPAEIRITSNQPEAIAFKFINIAGQSPEKFIQTLRSQPSANPPIPAAPVRNTTSQEIKPEVQLHHLSFKTVAAQVLDVKQLPAELSEKLPQMEVEIAFKQVTSPEKMILPPETRAAVHQLKVILQNPQMTDFSSKINIAAQTLIGKPLPAITLVRPEINLTTFQTPLGEVVSATPLRLDNQLPVELVIKSVITPLTLQSHLPSNPLELGTRLLEKLVEIPVAFKEDLLPADKNAAPSVNRMLEVLKPANLPAETMAAVIEKLPALGKQMLANLSNYVKGALHQDIKQWLGPELVERLSVSGSEGREALQQLNTVFANSARETPTWRLVEIPFYNGENLDKIRLAIKKYNDDEEETPEQQKQKYGTRFVVDTTFTKLGRFQFDGYSLLRDKRFDLIIRTERQLDRDFCANIMRIFNNTLHEVGYAGTIKLNVKENFIKIGEDITNETLLTGIFI